MASFRNARALPLQAQTLGPMTMVADASILLGLQLLVEGFPFLSVRIFMGPGALRRLWWQGEVTGGLGFHSGFF